MTEEAIEGSWIAGQCFNCEDEGFGDPSVATLQSDLAYLMSN